MRIHVDAETDARGALIPRRVRFAARRVDVLEVCDRWHGADYQYFKVIGDDGSLYILHLDERQTAWSLTMFASSGRAAPPPPPLPRGKRRVLQ